MRHIKSIKKWYAFPAVFIMWFFTVAASGCSQGTSSTGADVSINGDGNNICLAEVTSGEKTEIITIDCPYNQATSPETDPGTSQMEGDIPE